MNEEEFKKIISKSELQTSDDFMDQLMDTIEVRERETKKIALKWPFMLIVMTCLILVSLAIYLLWLVIGTPDHLRVILDEMSKTPALVITASILLYLTSKAIKLNEDFMAAKRSLSSV